MKHRSSQILFQHWNDKRAHRALPERSEIDPASIRGALGDTFILAFHPLPEHPFRLAGTRICALFGRELKNSAFADLWNDNGGSMPITRLLGTACDDAVGIVAGVEGTTTDGRSLELELVILPLKHCGQTHLRLIGTLSPLLSPQWLATGHLESLTLGGYRFLGFPREVAAATPMIRSPSTAPLGEPRMRRGLLVYDGGQA